jgi:hypothetical protein
MDQFQPEKNQPIFREGQKTHLVEAWQMIFIGLMTSPQD